MMRLIPYAGAEPAPLRQRERERQRRRMERKAAPVQRLVAPPPPSGSPRLPIGIWQIFSDVADKHDMAVADIRSDLRTQRYVAARFEVAYRLRVERGLSYALVGKYLGRDHTAALHAVRTHAERNGLPEPCV